MSILVCPLSQVETVVEARRPSHLITLLDPDNGMRTPKGLERDRHFKAECHDIAEAVEGLTAPDQALVERLIAFGRGWDASSPILIHCRAGISRSTATAFVLACDRNPHVAEAQIARELRRQSRFALPNPRIVALADRVLSRRGRMVDALDAMGAREPAFESEPFELASQW